MRPEKHVLVFQTGARCPVFHAWGESEFWVEPMRTPGWEERFNRYSTRCGRVIQATHWVTQTGAPWRQLDLTRESAGHTFQRFDNASRIGRPCRRCFPDLTNHATPGDSQP